MLIQDPNQKRPSISQISVGLLIICVISLTLGIGIGLGFLIILQCVVISWICTIQTRVLKWLIFVYSMVYLLDMGIFYVICLDIGWKLKVANILWLLDIQTDWKLVFVFIQFAVSIVINLCLEWILWREIIKRAEIETAEAANLQTLNSLERELPIRLTQNNQLEQQIQQQQDEEMISHYQQMPQEQLKRIEPQSSVQSEELSLQLQQDQEQQQEEEQKQQEEEGQESQQDQILNQQTFEEIRRQLEMIERQELINRVFRVFQQPLELSQYFDQDMNSLDKNLSSRDVGSIDEGQECVICYEPYQKKQEESQQNETVPYLKLITLPCKHTFHSSCLRSAFKVLQKRCPYCRQPVQKRDLAVEDLFSSLPM